jgi:hypothetical protein
MTEYIERGALIAFVREVRKKLPKESKDFFTRDEMLLNFQQYLESQKAADVEPVVRGECENCSSNMQTTDEGQPFSQEWYLTVNGCKFCPQCGRKLHMERSGSGE